MRSHPRRKEIRTSSTTLRQLFRMFDDLAISQDEVSRRLKIEQNRISRYKLGKASPSILRVEEMAQVIGAEIIVRMKE